MAKPKRAFEAKQLRTRYRGWELIATEKTCTGKKSNGEQFEINRLKDMETALRMGKNKVDRLEGIQTWDQNYTNEALR